jgi:hypothetical protein
MQIDRNGKNKIKKKDINLVNTTEYFTNGGVRSGKKIDKKYRKNILKDALIEKQKFIQHFHEYLPNCNCRPSKSVVATEIMVFNEDLYFVQSN